MSWHYVDSIGHSVEVDRRVGGRVSVEFTGAALPLATGKSTLRAASVELELPAFDDPSTLVKRTFLVRFETFDGGNSYSAQSIWGAQGSVIDASLPNAKGLFDATYDAAAQTTRPSSAYARPVTRVDLALTKQSAGDFKVAASVSGYEERDFARHSTTVSNEASVASDNPNGDPPVTDASAVNDDPASADDVSIDAAGDPEDTQPSKAGEASRTSETMAVKCGIYKVDQTLDAIYYRNCRSKAVKIHVNRKWQLDWTFCIPAGHTQKISDAWRYRGYTLLKVYDGSYCP